MEAGSGISNQIKSDQTWKLDRANRTFNEKKHGYQNMHESNLIKSAVGQIDQQLNAHGFASSSRFQVFGLRDWSESPKWTEIRNRTARLNSSNSIQRKHYIISSRAEATYDMCSINSYLVTPYHQICLMNWICLVQRLI